MFRIPINSNAKAKQETAAPAEFVQRAEAMIRHHCHGEQAEMLALVSSVEMSL
jgi:hypothetical protein